jgi:hypothetical protein
VLGGVQDPDNVHGARKLDPTDLLSEIFSDDHDAKHIRIMVKVPDECEPAAHACHEFTLTNVSARQHPCMDLLRNSQTLRSAHP